MESIYSYETHGSCTGEGCSSMAYEGLELGIHATSLHPKRKTAYVEDLVIVDGLGEEHVPRAVTTKVGHHNDGKKRERKSGRKSGRRPSSTVHPEQIDVVTKERSDSRTSKTSKESNDPRVVVTRVGQSEDGRIELQIVLDTSTTGPSTPPRKTHPRRPTRPRKEPSAVAKFLQATTTAPKLMMWSYLAWYLMVVILTWTGDLKPFKGGMVIMFFVGMVLNANAFSAFKGAVLSCPTNKTGRAPGLLDYLLAQPFSILRLFLIPFCVASYSGLTNTVMGTTEWILIFPTNQMVWVPALSAAIGLPSALRLASLAVEVCEIRRSK